MKPHFSQGKSRTAACERKSPKKGQENCAVGDFGPPCFYSHPQVISVISPDCGDVRNADRPLRNEAGPAARR